MARSSAVAAAIGGMLETNPCGMSTQTNGSLRSSRKESDSSRCVRSSSLVAELHGDR